MSPECHILMPYLIYGINSRMTEMRKITAILPTKLVEAAMETSGANLTETLRNALRDYNHHAASQRLLAMRGKVKLELDLEELREDREFDEHGNVIN